MSPHSEDSPSTTFAPMAKHADGRRTPWDQDGPPRILGDVDARIPGPTVVLVGGLHGNEPAGVIAIERVMATLSARSDLVAGRVVGLSGNRNGLARGTRYISRDLNRRWYENELARLASTPLELLRDEDREQRDLFDSIRRLEAGGSLVIIDLHTTSGKSEPFVCFGDTLANRRLALSLPVTAILGLEEVIDGAMLGHYADRGHVAISVEAGQHEDPETIERHTSMLWIALVASGAVRAASIPELPTYRSRLEAMSSGRPPIVEVRHRHVVHPGDEFLMAPGFSSLQPVREGTIVAHDRNGPILAPLTGLMLMPRYQDQGEDGYFLVRPVAPFWLKVSEGLRRAHAERVVSRLPGIECPDGSIDRLSVDARIARSRAVEILHLCGYRRARDSDGKLSFTRRRG